jgi:hypothetical protein
MNTVSTNIFQRVWVFLQVVRTKPSTLSTREWEGLGVVSLLLILCATTMPWTNFTGQAYWRQVVWFPFADACWRQWYLNDVCSNFILFMPLGWCMVFARGSHPQYCLSRVAMMALSLSLAVEFFQVFSLHRTPSMTDVSTNTTGALTAALQAISWQARESRAHRDNEDFVLEQPRQPIPVPVTAASQTSIDSHPWESHTTD